MPIMKDIIGKKVFIFKESKKANHPIQELPLMVVTGGLV